MTNLPQKEQIREAIISFREKKDISQKDLSTMIGTSDATLSKIENRKWDDINEKMWRRIWNKVRDANTPGTLETSDFVTCRELCNYAKSRTAMVGLTADTGMGKTTAFSHYAMNRNVFYVAIESSMQPKHFFTALLRQMGIDFIGNIHEMVSRVADELNVLNNPLLIIDEAGKLKHNFILLLHDLRNRTDKTTGIVLTGMPDFQRDIKKFSDRAKAGYSEFLRRISLWQSLDGLSSKEIKAICLSYGINDDDFIREVRNKRRFADLMNEINNYILENAA